MVVYKITNKINGKMYVGQTVQPVKYRWRKHWSGKGALGNAIKKYGKDNFEVEIIEKCSSTEEMNERETYHIKALNTLAPAGYNLTSGGERPKHTPESNRKNSESQKGRIPWNRGLTKEDPRVATMIRTGSDHHHFGKKVKRKKKWSQESRDRQSKLLSGRKLEGDRKTRFEEIAQESRNERKIPIFCDQNEKTYESICAACKDLDLNPGGVYNVIEGVYSQTKGYTFRKALK